MNIIFYYNLKFLIDNVFFILIQSLACYNSGKLEELKVLNIWWGGNYKEQHIYFTFTYYMENQEGTT